MKSRAYAKINLSLNVRRRREDGYHELESIMLPLNFYDELSIEKNDEMIYECDRPFIVFDQSNTVVKAISLMKERYGINDNFHVRLNKHIPMQAGLAGGSADGAAAIRILKKMYDIRMSEEDIRDICLKIGADVVFTYYNRPALVEGIGEKLTWFSVKKPYYVLLVKPSKGISTKECYTNLNLEKCDHPDVPKIRECLEKGEDFLDLISNSLEEPSLRLCSDIRRVREDLEAIGARRPLMSGSGSTVFVISENEEEIRRLNDEMRKKRYFVRYTEVRR